MNAALAQAVDKASAPEPEVRVAVKDLLLKSQSFLKLPAATQRQIAKDMVQVADYLAKPEGIPGNRLATAGALADPNDRSASTYNEDVQQVNKVGDGFKASAALQGAEVAGVLLKQVNFVTFVSGLIQGVFHAIVTASIEQMEAYGKLVGSISKSLNQFKDENVSENQGRDQLVEQFPDLFQIGSGSDDFFGAGGNGASSGPRVQLKDGVDEGAALARVNSSLPIEGGPLKSLDLEDAANEQKLVQAARTQLATSRQQLLATMVLMGINRIVVTDGKIQAKILYDFQARDNSRRQRSAVAMNYARDQAGNVQKTSNWEGEYEGKSEGGETKGKEGSDDYEHRDGNYYAKGNYKYSEKPVLTAMSTASEQSESALQTKAQLAGIVDVNFKSDYFPLEKMADSFQIGQIQNAARPGRGVAGAAPAPAAGQNSPAAAGTTAPAAQPAPVAAAQPAK